MQRRPQLSNLPFLSTTADVPWNNVPEKNFQSKDWSRRKKRMMKRKLEATLVSILDIFLWLSGLSLFKLSEVSSESSLLLRSMIGTKTSTFLLLILPTGCSLLPGPFSTLCLQSVDGFFNTLPHSLDSQPSRASTGFN